jgi:hypothetical protein
MRSEFRPGATNLVQHSARSILFHEQNRAEPLPEGRIPALHL